MFWFGFPGLKPWAISGRPDGAWLVLWMGNFLRVCFFVSDYEGDPSSPADCDAASRLAMAKICDVRFTIFAIRGVAT